MFITVAFQFAFLLALIAQLCNAAAVTTAKNECTSQERLHSAQQIPDAYNLSPLGASSAAFDQVPFADNCVTSIAADGLPPVVVGVNAFTTRLFAKTTRQVFSHVSGQYQDFASNRTSVILTNVTLGARDIVPIPFTFSAHVYLDFNPACQIEKVRAFAQVPSEVAGISVGPIGI